MFERLGKVAQGWSEQKGVEGIIAGEKTRRNLARRRKEQKIEAEKNLEKMIEDTARTSAL